MGFSMKNLEQVGNRVSVTLQPDDNGLTGRECPTCEQYFKIQFGTGLKGEDLPCHCPYCGHTGDQGEFTTKEQVEHVTSVALNRITGAMMKDLKSLEFDHRPRGAFGIGISMKVTGGATPIVQYREKDVETEVVCAECTLRYAIYGVFAFCPDCGTHNSVQILDKNLELIGKQLALAAGADDELRARAVADALGNAVASFDGFGREICRVHAAAAITPEGAANLSFQNLVKAQKLVLGLFGFDLANGLAADEWQLAFRCFQKRHLFAHCMGVVDEAYVVATGDTTAIVGRKVPLHQDEVRALLEILPKLGRFVSEQLRGSAPATPAAEPSVSIPPAVPPEPLAGYGLSVLAQRLAMTLGTRSEYGVANDDFLDVDDAVAELGCSLDEFELAADELDERGWMTLHLSANGPLRFHAISATSRLFEETDEAVKGWNTASDAKTIARTVVETGGDGMSLDDMSTRLGWPARRLNPAVNYLVESGYAEGPTGAHGAYPIPCLWLTPRLKRFAAK
jgi:hypothetical protein